MNRFFNYNIHILFIKFNNYVSTYLFQMYLLISKSTLTYYHVRYKNFLNFINYQYLDQLVFNYRVTSTSYFNDIPRVS